jgi:hypothetical protein
MDEERLPQRNLISIPTGRGKRGPNQNGKKAYSELWENVVYKEEAGKTEFGGDWVSKVVVIRHRKTAYAYIHIQTFYKFCTSNAICKYSVAIYCISVQSKKVKFLSTLTRLMLR